MKINSAVLAAPRREYPINREVLTRRSTAQGPIDSFDPGQLPLIRPVASQSAQLSTSSSSSGGFFSKLFSGVKSLFSGLLGKASSWLSTNLMPLIDKAKTFASGLVEGFIRKASTWLQSLIARWQGTIAS